MCNQRQSTFFIPFLIMVLALWSGQAMAAIEVQQGAQLENESGLYLCRISPDGTYAAVGGEGLGYVRIYKTSTGALTGTANLSSGYNCEDVELSNGGDSIFVGGQLGGVYRFSKTGTQIWNRPDITGELSVGVTAIGNLVFTVDNNENFHRLSGNTGVDLIGPVAINSRGWSIWGVDTTADGGNRVLIQTNSDIIITNGFGTETHFYDIATGNSIHYTDMSPDGSHFAVSYRDPVTNNINVALYEIGVGEKWTVEVSDLADVSMDDNDWVYVSIANDDNILFNTTGGEILRWNAPNSFQSIDVANDGSRCVTEESNSTYVYNFVDDYNCYPDLHIQLYVTDVVEHDADTLKYTLSVANWYDIPPELLAPAPELPACGLNDQAGRTYIRIFGDEGSFFFSGCGAWGDGTSSENLKHIQILVDDDETDDYVYIQFWDRKCDTYMKSVYAYLRKPCPVGDIDGDCIVNMQDLALMAANWMVDNNPI